MTASLVILCAAAASLVALATSVLVAGALLLSRRAVERTAPQARARLLLLAAVAPLLVSITVVVVALSPSFGWIADHCVPAGDPHGHPHLCAAHHVAALPGAPMIVLACLLAARLAFALGRLGRAKLLAERMRRALDGVARPQGDLRVLPLAEPHGFLLGAIRPALFVSQGLVTGPASHLAAVVAHERAHLSRRDPLWRIVAAFAGALHVPLIARWIERQLACAQEMAADDAAAVAVGSREAVAHALIALARAARPARTPGLAFAGGEVERRIERLLAPGGELRGPGARSLAVVASAILLCAIACADAVHHGLETTLGLLGG